MSSWSASYPARARSRSRSPYRGPPYPPRPGYGEPSHSGDSYRGEWDGYDRDRAWGGYDRERGGYDHRRGRSRSPPPDEVGRKRRRSLSPWERDRYEPRPRYGDDYDHSRHGHASPPNRGPYPPPSYGGNRRAPPDPHTMDYPASLKQYAEWFRYFYPQEAADEDSKDKAAEAEAGDGSKPRNGIRSKWEKYRKDYAAQQLQRMFEHHRKSPWFAEKYDPSPEFAKMRSRVRRVGWRGRIDAFLLDLEAGKFDPDLTEPEVEAEPATLSKESNGELGTNGIDSAPPATPVVDESKATNAIVDDDMQFNVEADDEPGDQDANRGDSNGRSYERRGRGSEEISIDPEGNQVMIRTIPPDIGRVKLEEACGKIPGLLYLALGDPLQKKNFYRAGWLRFRDDVDMTSTIAELSEKKIEGFKLHVAHITKPFTNKIRVTPELASKPERLEKDLSNAKTLAGVLEEEYSRLLREKAEIKAEAEAAAVTATNNGTPADAKMDGLDDDQDEEDREPREPGSIAVENRIEKVIADMREQGLFDGLDEREEETKRTTIALDLYLAYLRSAFNTCYYCAVTTDHVEELQRKCIKHVRKPLSKPASQEGKPSEQSEAEQVPKQEPDIKIEEDNKPREKEKDTTSKDKAFDGLNKRNDDRWLEWLDQKIALLINRNGVDPRDYGGKSYDHELSKAAEPFIKQEDEGKFRCKTCQKLFKATSFVEKHIANKHADLVKNLDELPYFNNFALDPHRIQPFTHPPQQIGNSQPPPQAYGLQGPPFASPMELSRGPPPIYAGSYPPIWDPYAFPYIPGSFPPPRRDESMTARRLSDRISGYAPGSDQHIDVPLIPPATGLPAKPMVSLDVAPAANGGRRGRGGTLNGPPPPPPPDAKEDPRASAGRKISYHDMDLVAEGDVELTY